MSRAAATIVAKSQLPAARVLADSLRRFHPDIPFYVLLIDETDDCFDPDREHFHLLHLARMQVPNYPSFRFRYRMQELLYASTPFLLAHLIERFDQVVFLKQESLVIGDLGPTLRQLEDSTILLTPHLLAPLAGEARIERELNILLSGVFNVGFVGLSATPVARNFLAWWQDRLYEHCQLAVADGMHFEQRWLDLVPVYFDGVQIARDPGLNVGHWNLLERDVRFVDGVAMAGDHPCRYIRFSGFSPDRPTVISAYSSRTVDSVGPAAELFRTYAALMEKAGYHEAKAWRYSFDFFDNGVPVPEIARQLYRELAGEAHRFGDPLETDRPGSFQQWLNSPARNDGGGQQPVTRLWYAIYKKRPDVQHAFPDVFGADREKFLDWAARHGANEFDISPHFVEWQGR